jgi:hypothetical protein
MLQRGNRLQIPKIVRWRYKLESDQILIVDVNAMGLWTGHERFYATMGKDGRILVPQLILAVLKQDKPNLEHHVFEVMLIPS